MNDPARPDSGCWLLVADLDETLLGTEDGLSELVGLLRRSPRLLWALNSSRPLASVRASLQRRAIDAGPDAWIGAMGTEIETREGPVPAWRDRFAGWSRAPVDAVMRELGFPAHDADFQTPFKASFAVPAAEWDRARRAIADAGVPARTVGSGASDFDVLPLGAGKGEATRFLAGHLGIDPARLVVAGDSANDLAMFRVSRRGIVVANAREELRRAVEPGRAYFARESHAHGVLEGLRHWGAPIGEGT